MFTQGKKNYLVSLRHQSFFRHGYPAATARGGARERRNKLEPVVTLHHFVQPLWFDRLGGFTSDAGIPYFVNFATFAIRCAARLSLGSLTQQQMYFKGGWGVVLQ